jgi:hypothetical protein
MLKPPMARLPPISHPGGGSGAWPCRLRATPLRDVDGWMAPYRAFFEDRFDRLEEHLRTMVSDQQNGSAIPGTK